MGNELSKEFLVKARRFFDDWLSSHKADPRTRWILDYYIIYKLSEMYPHSCPGSCSSNASLEDDAFMHIDAEIPEWSFTDAMELLHIT